jgi:DNA-binding CsgD family transcriptional regulator
LMRLQISTKEIASLTNRTIGTIDNTRSQIRKKLKLEDSDNLQEYLTSI